MAVRLAKSNKNKYCKKQKKIKIANNFKPNCKMRTKLLQLYGIQSNYIKIQVKIGLNKKITLNLPSIIYLRNIFEREMNLEDILN